MKCPICGKEIANGSMFCEYCGAQVKKNKKPLFIAIAIVACLLIFGGIGLTMYQEQARIERELLISKREAAEAEAKAEHEARLKAEAETKAKAEHEARLKAEERLEQELAEKAKYNGHEYVDLGLSVKWATCNVGASKPEDYGNYYAWGETSTKSSYTESNCKTCVKRMGNIKGNSSYDAARANWGGTWRLPTKAELEELNNKCTWKWTTHNGVKGCKVTGPNGNSIFLPAAGRRDGSSLDDAGGDGDYWSSTPYDGNFDCYAYWLDLNSNYQDVGFAGRYRGRSVRPVVE